MRWHTFVDGAGTRKDPFVFCIVMELATGGNLAQLIAKGEPLSEERIREILVQLASALHHIQLLLKKMPNLLEKEFQSFFCRYNEPGYVKTKKLEILTAITAASTRERTPSFRNTALTCSLTVPSVISKRCAMTLLLCPSDRCSSISSSRGVKLSNH